MFEGLVFNLESLSTMKQSDSVPVQDFGKAWFAVSKVKGKKSDVRQAIVAMGHQIDAETFEKRLPQWLQALANAVAPTGEYETVVNKKTEKEYTRMVPTSVTVVTSKACPSDYGLKGPRMSEETKSELANMFAEFA